MRREPSRQIRCARLERRSPKSAPISTAATRKDRCLATRAAGKGDWAGRRPERRRRRGRARSRARGGCRRPSAPSPSKVSSQQRDEVEEDGRLGHDVIEEARLRAHQKGEIRILRRLPRRRSRRSVLIHVGLAASARARCYASGSRKRFSDVAADVRAISNRFRSIRALIHRKTCIRTFIHGEAIKRLRLLRLVALSVAAADRK